MFFSFLDRPYVAVIGDMKGSKMLQDRKTVQDRLKQVLETVNQKYSQDISAKFMITLGDEFQGLLCCGASTMRIITEITREMYPVRIRFGIGIGAITTDINSDMAIGADGPGFYRARDAIEYLKQKEKRKQTDPAGVRFGIDGGNQESEILMNTVLTLLTVIEDAWSDRQRQVIGDMLEHGDSQSNAALRFDIKQSTVQRILAKGNYYAYKEALDTIGKALEEIKPNDL